ncbi:MAG: SPOR domain-containing protein, partial [Hyphomicrobiales bacterium]
PKISNEFKGARSNPRPEAQADAGAATDQRSERPRTVARPAPMAPRAQPQAKPQPQPANPLAERLKTQRQAAEKLAEQRIQAARSAKAEAKPADKPKFTFAAEEIEQAKRETPTEQKRAVQPSVATRSASPAGLSRPSQPSSATTQPSLVPPRFSLGGDRPIVPPSLDSKPAPSAGPPPRFQASPPPQPAGYRPLDPPAYHGRQPAMPPRPGNYPPAGYAPQSRPALQGYEAPGRRVADEGGGGDEPYLGSRGRQRPIGRGRQPAFEEDFGEVFENEAPAPRRRASAQDYHQAYREYDEGYDADDRRRSGGPWIVALVLFLVAAAAVAGWYYFYYLRAGGPTVSGQVPVIAAPDKPAKTEPEPIQPNGSNAQGALDNPTERRKQIYDRVTGEEPTEGNKIVPTEEQPQQVEPAGGEPQQPAQGQGASPGQQGNATADPSQSSEPSPLPLPPPPGSTPDQQGSLASSSTRQVAALNGSSVTSSAPAVAQPASSGDLIAPVPGDSGSAAKSAAEPVANDRGVPVKQPDSAPETPQAAIEPIEPPPAKVAESKPVQQPPSVKPAKPAKQKTKTAKSESKKKVVSAEAEQVATPPTEPTVIAPDPAQAQNAAPVQDQPLPDRMSNTAPQKKSGAFFDFLKSGNASGKPRPTGKRDDQIDASTGSPLNAGSKPASEPQPPPVPDQQVASIAPDTQPEISPPPEPKAQTGGYLAQLASFRSEAEALAEYDRLRAKYGDVVGGLSPKVTKASVSGTTRYRLGVGPVGSREAAARICNSLIAAGERDCLVRGN